MIRIEHVLLSLLLFCFLFTGFDVHAQQVMTNALVTDIRFASGNSALKIPFELYNNHIYLQVGVNGSKPLTLLFDTGAPHIIDSKQAKALGLKLKFLGHSTTGVGEGLMDVYKSKGVSFNLPGVSLSGQQVGVMSLENVAACASEIVIDERGHFRKCEPNEQCQRRVIDGVLGHDFFKRFVVEIDYEARLINVYAPGNYKYQGTGESFPLEITAQQIFVQASLSPTGRAPLNGRFMIDTGGAHSLLLTKPFVEINKLRQSAQGWTKSSVCGLGGNSGVLIGTVSALQLGNIKINEPVTVLSQAQDGELANADYAGNIGAGILRHFKVIFDYSRSRMILESPAKG